MPPLQLTDTHCHLDFKRFNQDRAKVIARAISNGLTRILNVGIDLESSREAVRLAQDHDQIYAAVGLHPNSATLWNSNLLSQLRDLASHPKVVAIGEIGLDFYRDRAPQDLQKRVFHTMLTLASDLDLPVVIHNREATSEVLDMLEAWYNSLESSGSIVAQCPGVLHSFSGDLPDATRAMHYNFLIGISGPVTFRNAHELQTIVAELPDDSILIETDAPFLTPHPYRGKRNEPSHVRFVAAKIAELRETSLIDIARITLENSNRIFNWDQTVDNS